MSDLKELQWRRLTLSWIGGPNGTSNYTGGWAGGGESGFFVSVYRYNSGRGGVWFQARIQHELAAEKSNRCDTWEEALEQARKRWLRSVHMYLSRVAFAMDARFGNDGV